MALRKAASSQKTRPTKGEAPETPKAPKTPSGRKAPHTDGLGARELAKIRGGLRVVWHRSRARKLCVERCTDAEGYGVCEACFGRTPTLKIDHVVPCGGVEGLIERMFCPSSGLMGLCPTCHNEKTKAERKALREAKK